MADEIETLETNENLDESLGGDLPESSASVSSFTTGAKSSSKGSSMPFGLDTKNAILLGVAAVTLSILIFQFFFAPKYKLLYTDLKQSDAAAISSYLEKSGVNFQISPDGTSINVASTSVPKLRLDLANKGLPRGGNVGFEIFDKTSLNISDFNQKINYKRALEGELARTISSLEAIKTAKVHLALAKKSLFKSQETKSKASVVVVTNFGQELTEKQTKSIQHLVGSAVEGLDADAVQITDAQGNSLVKFKDANTLKEEALSANEMKVKEYESKLEGDLTTLLTPILGAGNVLVNVSADMNFDESEVNIEVFNPVDETGKEAKPVVRSEKVISEKYNREKGRKFGTAGAMHELPGFLRKETITNPAGGDGRDYIKEDKTKNYEISRQIEKIKKASGLVNKVSVAVVVNKTLNASERSTLRETVQVAAGLNMERGDQVIVTGIKFSSTPYTDLARQKQEKEIAKMEQAAQMKKLISIVLVIVAVLIIIMVVMLSLNAGIDDNKAKEIDDLLKEENLPILNSIDEKLQEAEEAYHRQLSLEGNVTVDSMKQGISQMALKDPKTVAQALQSYLND
jgi:flagellar M-ring protein FliF